MSTVAAHMRYMNMQLNTTSRSRPRTGLALALAAVLAASPLAAGDETTGPANPEIAEGAEMLSQGLRKLFRGLLDELEPAGEAAEQGWSDLVEWLGDLSAYEAPERLPNGDIVIRRKEPLTPGTEL